MHSYMTYSVIFNHHFFPGQKNLSFSQAIIITQFFFSRIQFCATLLRNNIIQPQSGFLNCNSQEEFRTMDSISTLGEFYYLWTIQWEHIDQTIIQLEYLCRLIPLNTDNSRNIVDKQLFSQLTYTALAYFFNVFCVWSIMRTSCCCSAIILNLKKKHKQAEKLI